MIYKENKYVIASNNFPLKFYDRYGCEVNTFQDVMISENEDAKDILGMFDEPEQFQILKIGITYEI